MCCDCEECSLEGGNSECEIQTFEMQIDSKAEYKSSVVTEEKKNEK